MKTRVVLFLLSVLIANGAVAGVWRVEQDGSGDFMVIQDAVDAAASGDTIMIGPGSYRDPIWYPELNGASIAYWGDDRDLSFIGSSPIEVVLGPESYVPVGSGPAGIGANQGVVIRVENISFVNLMHGISSQFGSIHVSNSYFSGCKHGVWSADSPQVEIHNCSFRDIELYAVTTYRAQYAEIVGCSLENAVINFNDTDNGIVRNCTVTGGSLVRYFLSQGLVEDCHAMCDGNVPCIGVSDSDTVRFYDNFIRGGNINLNVTGASTNVFLERNDISHPSYPGDANFYFHNNASVFAHDNHINRSSIMVDYVIYTTTYTESFSPTIDMGSNYWFDDGTPERLDSLIHDGNDDPALNIIVNYEPIRTEPVPVEKKSLGGLKALFR